MSDAVTVIYEVGTYIFPGCKHSTWVVHKVIADMGDVICKLPETHDLLMLVSLAHK